MVPLNRYESHEGLTCVPYCGEHGAFHQWTGMRDLKYLQIWKEVEEYGKPVVVEAEASVVVLDLNQVKRMHKETCL